MTKIVILDGYALNPGDLSWEPIQTLGQCDIYDRTETPDIIERCQNADIVITNKVPFNRETIAQLPQLKYIGVTATGYNIIDIDAAKEKGIVVTNVPSYSTASVAQMTFSLLLEITNQTGHHAQTVRAGRWRDNPDFCYWDHPITELDNLTLGIIGFGEIGQAVADIAKAFGMRVLAHSRSDKSQQFPEIDFVDLERCLSQSDVISLHCPATPQTNQLINRETLKLMKPHAILLNTSRGQLIHEQDLADALNNGEIAAAGLDVLSTEPPSKSNPLLTAKNCTITPHIAWASLAARKRLVSIVIENVKNFMSGNTQNVVN